MHFVLFTLDLNGALCIILGMQFTNHRDIIEIVWGGSLAAYAKDAAAEFEAASSHRTRNSIPADYWPAVVAHAKARGFSDVTEKLLAELKPPRKNGRACHAKSAQIVRARHDIAECT